MCTDLRLSPDLMAWGGSPRLKQAGVTLIELIIFIIIISVAATGILLVMNQVTTHSADPLLRKQALAIAESLLEEIQLLPVNPGNCTGGLGANAVRTGAGCVSDYAGYKTTAGIMAFSSIPTVIPALAGYNITSVVVTPVTPFGGTAIDPAVGFAFQITVTVADPQGNSVDATGYRAGQ